MRERLTVGSVFARTLALVLDDVVIAVPCVALLVAVATAIGDDFSMGILLPSIMGIVVQYFLTRHVVARNGLLKGDRPGDFWNMFGANFLTGIGIVLTCIALVIPGLYLAARWSLCSTIVVARRQGATEAIDESWRLTKSHGWTIMAIFVLIWAPALIGMVTIAIIADQGDVSQLPLAIASNLLQYLATVFGWYACVAIYAVLVGAPEENLREVFA